MSIKLTQSPIFKDLDYCEITHVYKPEDFDYKVRLWTDKETIIENDKREVAAEIYFYLKDDKLAENLKENNIAGDYPRSIYEYNGKYISGTKFEDELMGKVGMMASAKRDFNYRGTRGEKGRSKRISDTIESFKENLPNIIDDRLKEVSKEFNEWVKRKCDGLNEKLGRNYHDLFTGDRYKGTFKDDWEKSEKIKSLQQKKEPIQQEIGQLQNKLNEINSKIHNQKIDIVKNILEKYKDSIPQDYYQEIIKRLESGNVFTKKRGPFG